MQKVSLEINGKKVSREIEDRTLLSTLLRDILKDSLGKDIDIVDKQGLLDHNNTFILEKAIYV